jgi:DNA-binding MarR family transcriptional regulator
LATRKASEDYLPRAMREMEAMVSRFQAHALEKFTQYMKGETFALAYLFAKDAPVQPSELSRASGSSSARIAMLLGNLEQKGLVTRAPDPKDRRKTLVTLTEKGAAKAKAQREKYTSEIEAVFREMGARDTEDFLRTTRRFLEIAEAQK